MTGLYPPGHGVWDNGVPLNRRDYVPYNTIRHGDATVVQPATMADIFDAAGYETALFGKLHLTPYLSPSGYPYHESYNNWREHEEEMNAWHGPYYGFRYVDLTVGHGPFPCGHHNVWLKKEYPEIFDIVKKASEKKDVSDMGDVYTAPMPLELHPTLWLADRFEKYLRTIHTSDTPFFAFIGFPDPHHPFVPTEEAVKRFEGSPVAGPYDNEGVEWKAYNHAGMGNPIGELDKAEKATILRHTNAMIWQIDCAVGRIIDTLQRRNLRDDTIIVFTSDHGDFLCDHGRLRKGVGAAHQLLHVPCIINIPGQNQGKVVDTAMSNCDMLPTLTSLAGVPLNCRVDGRDVFNEADTVSNPYAFAYCSVGTEDSINFTIYDETYRYTVYPHIGKKELFNHAEDPWEAVNRAKTPTKGERAKIEEFQSRLERHLFECYSPVNGRISAW